MPKGSPFLIIVITTAILICIMRQNKFKSHLYCEKIDSQPEINYRRSRSSVLFEKRKNSKTKQKSSWRILWIIQLRNIELRNSITTEETESQNRGLHLSPITPEINQSINQSINFLVVKRRRTLKLGVLSHSPKDHKSANWILFFKNPKTYYLSI